MKLLEFYIDFNNLPEVIFGCDDDYIHLEKYIKLFNLCMGNDVDFSQRIKLIQNYKDLLLKILIISTFTSNICCCYHGFRIKTVTCHKDDVFDPVVGVAIAVSSFVFGTKKNFHDVVQRKIKKSTKAYEKAI